VSGCFMLFLSNVLGGWFLVHAQDRVVPPEDAECDDNIRYPHLTSRSCSPCQECNCITSMMKAGRSCEQLDDAGEHPQRQVSCTIDRVMSVKSAK